MERSEFVFKGTRVYHLGLSREEMARHIILVGDPARAYIVAEYFDEIESEIKHREYVTLTGKRNGQRLSVIGTGMGTDNIEIALAELYGLYEFDPHSMEKREGLSPLVIIRIGTSGGVQADIPVGTMGITSYGLGLDNTGLYYDHPIADEQSLHIEKATQAIINQGFTSQARFKGKIFPYVSKASRIVEEALIEACEEEGASFVRGITASTPGFYGPSARYLQGLNNSIPQIKQKLAQLQLGELRIINMEMESSILFHICRQLGYFSGTICPIISNPNSSADIVDYQATIHQAIQIGLKSMQKLA